MKNISSIIHNNGLIYFINKKNDSKIDIIKNEFNYLFDEEIDELINIETNYLLGSTILEDLKDYCEYKGEYNLLKNINNENIIQCLLE
jgi:hypothetical protein